MKLSSFVYCPVCFDKIALGCLLLCAAFMGLLYGCSGPDIEPAGDSLPLEERISIAQTGLIKDLSWKKPEDLLAEPAAINCPSYQVLGVTVVLTSKQDGSNALWQIEGGTIVPAEPHLRDSEIHPPGRDFIKDSLDIANHIFIASGACFLFDAEPRYVVEKNDILSKLICDDSAENIAYARHYFERKASEDTPDNPYKNRVLIFYPWGTDASPSGQGCSGIDSSYVKMASHFRWVLYADGKLVLGNNQLTHELGHFMGLDHPFPYFATTIKEDVDLDNPMAYPLSSEYLPSITEARIEAVAEQAKNSVLEWPYSFDQDNAPYVVEDRCCEALTTLPPVDDTPADLGMGFPLSQSQLACSGDRLYELEHYRCFVEDPPGSKTYVPDTAHPEKEKLSFEINDRVRNNIMSYWQCGPFEQRFSEQQRDRMHYALKHLESRRNLVMESVQRPVVGGDVGRFVSAMKEFVKPFPRYDPEKLRKSLRRHRDSSGLSHRGPVSALSVATERATGDAVQRRRPSWPVQPCE